ncbi:2,5-diketo-D-gluconate reductase A [Nocardioides albertanoniae]|uniref:2,5-diketo-D-gluconate reductase A n=1 Tax=Nocardioides albertanoniae TaxID=1175486 RepID=A0A543A2I6_9ACTN|nr:aldo/keto reductase [Nocardioides albertanoniae]TQL66799.1 2,5-diketo-D-gluconate reductase A [Nocardioides albertanoniae]
MTVPTNKLNDGTSIPQFGIGVWQVPQDEAEQVVSEALEVGYRHIDTAQMYQNEAGVGAALKSAGLARDYVYVTTKLNNSHHDPAAAKASLEKSLEKLGLDRVDLFLIHWPLPTQYGGAYAKTWEALVGLREEGLATSVGVSNFQPNHLDEIVAATGVVPAVNQIEVHPYFTNEAARAATQAHGAKVESWSPLGQGGGELTDPAVTVIAEAHGKSPAQVLLRWQIERGDIVFPKSVRRERLEENLEIFDFELTADEVASLAALDKGEAGRAGPNPDTFDWIPAS